MMRPIHNKARDDAWAKVAEDPRMVELCSEEGFKFPLARGYYELWCVCWEEAWQDGWQKAYEARTQHLDTVEAAYNQLSILHTEAMQEIVELHKRLRVQPSLWDRFVRLFK